MKTKVTLRKGLYRYLIDNEASAPYFKEIIMPFYKPLRLDRYSDEELLKVYKLFRKYKFTKNTVNAIQDINYRAIKVNFRDITDDYMNDFKLTSIDEIEKYLILVAKIAHIVNNCKNFNSKILKEFEIDLRLNIMDNYTRLLNNLEQSLEYNRQRNQYMNTKEAKQLGIREARNKFYNEHIDKAYKKPEIDDYSITTIVYHGSNHNFQTLRISERLVNSEATLRNEGLGIYFSTNPEVAKSYGRYLYTLEINNKYLKDFRDQKTCDKYLMDIVKYIKAEFNIDIRDFLDIRNLSYRIQDGDQCITELPREVYMLLDSSDRFYTIHESKLAKIEEYLNKYCKQTLKAFMFNYHIPDIGVIKDVSSNVVRISSKHKLY